MAFSGATPISWGTRPAGQHGGLSPTGWTESEYDYSFYEGWERRQSKGKEDGRRGEAEGRYGREMEERRFCTEVTAERVTKKTWRGKKKGAEGKWLNAQQWQRNNRWKSCYRIVPRSRLDGKREMVVLHKRKDEKGRGSDNVVKTEGGRK